MLVSIRSFAPALLSCALAAGCASAGHVKAEKTADKLGDLKASIEELRDRVLATSTSLASLVAQKDQDPVPTFQQLESNVESLRKCEKRVDALLEGVRTQAESYFTTWKEQAATINDEDLKERSEDRRVALSAALDQVAEDWKPARTQVDTYLASLQDTVKYLSIDLTPQAIASIEGRSKSAGKSSKSVSEELTDVLETVQKAAPMFARAAPAGPRPSLKIEDPSN